MINRPPVTPSYHGTTLGRILAGDTEARDEPAYSEHRDDGRTEIHDEIDVGERLRALGETAERLGDHFSLQEVSDGRDPRHEHDEQR